MSLKLRPTGLGSGSTRDRVDHSVFSGEWLIGRIYERRGFPDDVRWVWSLHGIALSKPLGIHSDGRAATLEAAKAEFQASWRRWLEGAKLGEVP